MTVLSSMTLSRAWTQIAAADAFPRNRSQYPIGITVAAAPPAASAAPGMILNPDAIDAVVVASGMFAYARLLTNGLFARGHLDLEDALPSSGSGSGSGSGTPVTPATVLSTSTPLSPTPAGSVGVSTAAAHGDHRHPTEGPSVDAGNLILTGADGKSYLSLSAAEQGVPTSGTFVLGWVNGTLSVIPTA